MNITPAVLTGIFNGFNTIFNRAFQQQQPQYTKIATVVTSTAAEETYAWLGDIPGMREWIGDREIQNLSGHGYTIHNKEFELTVGVKRKDIMNDKIGLYNPSVEMLGESAAMHPDELCFGLLSDGFNQKCFDEQTFYSDKHKIGDKQVSNKMASPLSLESYAEARSSMMGLKNGKKKSLGLVPNLLVVPPALEKKAREILMADQINGTTNTMKGTATLHVEPRLNTDTEWHLLCTTRPVKPVIYQQRQKPKFVSMTAETSTNVFMSGEYLYGVDSSGNAGYGFWQMAVGSTGKG